MKKRQWRLSDIFIKFDQILFLILVVPLGQFYITIKGKVKQFEKLLKNDRLRF